MTRRPDPRLAGRGRSHHRRRAGRRGGRAGRRSEAQTQAGLGDWRLTGAGRGRRPWGPLLAFCAAGRAPTGGTTESTHYPITDTCALARLGAGAARLGTGGALAGEAGGRSRGALNRAMAGASSPAFRRSPYRALATAWRRALAISRVCTGGSRYGGAGQARRPDPRTRTAARRAGNGRSQGAGAGAGSRGHGTANRAQGPSTGFLRRSHCLACATIRAYHARTGNGTGGGQCHVGAPTPRRKTR